MASHSPEIPDAQGIRDAPQQKPRRRRWLWGLLLLVTLSFIGLYFAPSWLAHHFQHSGVTFREESGGAFSLRADEVSLGWFSPARLSDVSIRDQQGNTLMTAESVVSERQLMRLVTNLTRPGRFVISKPYLDVRVRENGSNLEDLIQTLLSRDRSNRGLSEGAIAIHDGRIDVHDPQGKLLATIEDVDFTGSHRRAAEREIHFELTSLVLQEGQRRSLQAAADWRGPRDGLPLMSGNGTAAVKFDPFSLQLLQPYLKRLFPGLTIHKGSLAGQLLVECDFTDKMTLAATSQLLTTDLHATTQDNAGKTREYRWQDEELALQIDGTFDPQDDVVTVSDVTLQSTPVSMTASGTIVDVHGESLVDLSGNLQYDITPLIASLESEYGQHIHVEELQTRTIRIQGPLARRIQGRPHWDISRLSLEADLGWKAADVFGVKSEQATIVAKVNNGVLSIDPRDVPVSGGRFTASPRVMFPNGQPVTHLPNGPALEDVQFSPEMCHLWLKYLSPPLADATRINGRFSISVEKGQIPLNRLADGRLRGQLHVHGAEVRPGAFAEKMIGIVGTVQTLIVGKAGWTRAASDRWLAMEDQQIPFVMEGGRVHHERLEFLVAGATVRTSGSVGFDDSVNLLISIPLPESWLDKGDLRGMLGGEVIRIPVRGTLDRPQFDLLPLRELAQRMAVRATGGLLQKLLD